MSKLALSGYKTNLGLVIVGVGMFLAYFGITLPPMMMEVGWGFIGVGGVHRVLKDTGAVKG